MVRSLRRKSVKSEFSAQYSDAYLHEFFQSVDKLDVATVIFLPGGGINYYSKNATSFGVIRDDKVTSDSITSAVRATFRSKLSNSYSIEVPLGPIGEGTRRLNGEFIYLNTHESVVAFFSDESEAERIDAVRQDFVANISHELKTPISALRTLSEAVIAAASDPQVVKFAGMMSHEVDRLSNLVQEIINLSRLQDSDPLLDAITVDIDEAIDQAIDQCRVIADKRNIEIVRGPNSNVDVIGDRTHLIMAFHNLIENAVNYSPERTRVTVSTTVNDRIVEINVVDQGVGIPEPDLKRIFERFYRIDPARSRETGGSGLGLSIVKHVVSKHGGEVSVWSAPNVGSTFSIRLPIGEEVINQGDIA